MSNLTNIISTKELSDDLLNKLDPCLYNTIHNNYITTTPIPFNKTEILNSSKHWIVTSKNSLHILLTTYSKEELNETQFYCVGDKTAKLITDNKLNLITTATSSANLAHDIVEKYNHFNFTFICGEMRRNELDRILKSRKIQLNEFNIYSTTLSPIEVKRSVDGILFFSPSAITSYTSTNTITSETLFCIGETTATEAKKHSTNIIIAESQTLESVIESVKNYYT